RVFGTVSESAPSIPGGRHDWIIRTVDADPDFVSARFHCELDHPYAAAVAQGRLSLHAERSEGNRRAPPPCDTAWRLHGPPLRDQPGNAFSGIRGKVEAGARHGSHRTAERSVDNGKEPVALVSLLRGGHRLR